MAAWYEIYKYANTNGSSLLFSGLLLSSEGSDSAKAFNVSKERAPTKKIAYFIVFLMVLPRYMELKQSFTKTLQIH